MTGFTIEQFPDEPILLVAYQTDWELGRDGDRLHDTVWHLLESATSPQFYIVDLTIEPRFTLDDLMMVARKLLRGSTPILRHPNMREHLIVTQHPVIQRAFKALPWGLARGFDTLDDALAYARGKLAE